MTCEERIGSSRNNLHDELIADFCGLYAAFGKYRAAWFIKFFNLRAAIYTQGLSVPAADVLRVLAMETAKGAEEWTKTEAFERLDEAGRIEYLAGKELLEYVCIPERNRVSRVYTDDGKNNGGGGKND